MVGLPLLCFFDSISLLVYASCKIIQGLVQSAKSEFDNILNALEDFPVELCFIMKENSHKLFNASRERRRVVLIPVSSSEYVLTLQDSVHRKLLDHRKSIGSVEIACAANNIKDDYHPLM